MKLGAEVDKALSDLYNFDLKYVQKGCSFYNDAPANLILLIKEQGFQHNDLVRNKSNEITSLRR